MSATATYVRRNQNLYRQKTAISLGPISVGFVTVLAVSVLALLYLNQITKTSVFGYKTTELSTQRDQILASKQELEVEAARLQAVSQVQASPVVAKMVPEGAVTYAKAQ